MEKQSCAGTALGVVPAVGGIGIGGELIGIGGRHDVCADDV